MAKKNIATFLGPQLGLSVVGDHAYAYGKVTSSAGTSADITALVFTTGNYYSVFDYIGFVNDETSTSRPCYVDIFMNNSKIFGCIYNNPQDMRNDQPLQLLIPPRTNFEFKVGQQTGGTNWSVIMSGRIYNV